MKHIYILFYLSSIVFMTSCESKDIKNTTVLEVKQLLKNDPSYSLIDVRTPQEFSDGAIPTAINIDVMNDNFLSEIEKLNKKDKYIIYCRSGKRSLEAYELMTTAGFKNLQNLQGGYAAYSKK